MMECMNESKMLKFSLEVLTLKRLKKQIQLSRHEVRLLANLERNDFSSILISRIYVHSLKHAVQLYNCNVFNRICTLVL